MPFENTADNLNSVQRAQEELPIFHIGRRRLGDCARTILRHFATQKRETICYSGFWFRVSYVDLFLVRVMLMISCAPFQLIDNALNFTTSIVRRNLEDSFQLSNKLPPRPLRISTQSPPSLAGPEGYPLFGYENLIKKEQTLPLYR